MENGIIADPVKYPTVTLGGKSFRLKFTCLRFLLLEDKGLFRSDLAILGKEPPARKFSIRDHCEIIATAISSSEKLYTAEQVAEMTDDPMELFKATLAITDAIKKASPQAKDTAQAA